MTDTTAGCWPALKFDDAEAALGYLVEVLGFTESVVYRGADDRIDHAELRWPAGGGIMFGTDGKDRWSRAAGAPGTATVYLFAEDLDAVHDRVRAAGWLLLQPLQQTDYGARTFAAADPEGNGWSVGSYRGHST